MTASDPEVPPTDVALMLEPGESNPWDHYLVYSTPDTIARKDTSKLTIIAVDYANYEVIIPSNTQLTLSIDSTQFGSFLNASGQKVASPLTGVLYGDARGGRIKFVADGRDFLPDSFKTVQIHVTDGTKGGDGKVVIGRKKIRIIDRTPWKVWPYLSTADKGANRPGYNARRPFTVEVRDARHRLLANQEVMIMTSFVIESGGHVHTTSHDTLPSRSLQGSFWKMGAFDNPLSGLVTDGYGRVTVDSIRASQFSGDFVVSARLTADTTIYDTLRLRVMVDSLVDFGAGQYWQLSGVPGDSNFGYNHASSHWCTQKMKDSLEEALELFYDWSETSAGWGRPVTLGVNDMSLQTGGDFDFPGRWANTSRHEFHRVGLSVDIDNYQSSLRTVDPNNPRHGIFTAKGAKLEKFMNDNGGFANPERQIYFAFDRGS